MSIWISRCTPGKPYWFGTCGSFCCLFSKTLWERLRVVVKYVDCASLLAPWNAEF